MSTDDNKTLLENELGEENDTKETEETTETTDTPEAPATEAADETSAEESSEAEATTETPALSAPEEPKKLGSGMKKQLAQVALVVAGLAVVTGLTTTGILTGGKSNTAATLNSGDPIAYVNGQAITEGQFEQQKKQAAAFLGIVGNENQDEGFDAELQQRIIDDLVNAEVLYQSAVAAGHSASDEAVEAEYNLTMEQVGDEATLETQLATIGLNKTTLREVIHRQLTIEAYIEAETNIDQIEVTDEEVQALYNEFFGEAGEDGPTIDDIRPQIEAELINQKTSQAVNDLIERLRAAAEVEVLI